MTSQVSPKNLLKTMQIAERFFGTQKDPEQMPINLASYDKIQKLSPYSLICELKNDEPVSWVVTVPTSKVIMNKFISKEINEKQLLEISNPQDKYDAIYLSAAFTLPDHRRQHLATKLFLEAISKIPHTDDVDYFGWIYSKEGRKLGKTLEKKLMTKILTRE